MRLPFVGLSRRHAGERGPLGILGRRITCSRAGHLYPPTGAHDVQETAVDAYVRALSRRGVEQARVRPWYRAYLVPAKLFDDETAARYRVGQGERRLLRQAAGAIVYENGYGNRAFVEVCYYPRGDELYREWAAVRRAAGESAVPRESVPPHVDRLDVLLWLWIAQSMVDRLAAGSGLDR